MLFCSVFMSLWDKYFLIKNSNSLHRRTKDRVYLWKMMKSVHLLYIYDKTLTRSMMFLHLVKVSFLNVTFPLPFQVSFNSFVFVCSPFILGNLWDVTDRDIDRFTKALLESWLSAGSGASILEFMSSSRQATNLKHLIGAAPVVYGLPVHLQ